jgi:CRP-like cAMP-binding protein
MQSEVANNMDIILKGEVAVQNIDEDGKVLTVNVFTSMDVIAANLLFSTKNYYPMTVIAKSSVKIMHMHREHVLNLLKCNDKFMQNYITMLSDRTVTLTDKIQAISLKSIRQRLIEFIRYEYHLQKSLIIELNISKKNLAQRFGIERSSLSRELNKMRSDGLVVYDSKTITIKDKSIL